MFKVLLPIFIGYTIFLAIAQEPDPFYPQSDWPYIGPSDNAKKWYDDAKFGLFIHWGPISQWGDDLSWPLFCPSFPCTVQSVNHTYINITNKAELAAHRKAYYSLADTFNPTKFDPDNMARIAKRTGFKYVVFICEHCDGFCTYNTSYSNYNIFNTPYKKDLFAMINKAFRAQGLKVGAYFCPSLWNNANYWIPDPLTALGPGCEPNYNPQSNLQQWNPYMEHIHNQVKELAEKYKPDIFWIDCINAPPAVDLRFEEIAPLARSLNPDVMITNRAGGLLQDFITLNDQTVNGTRSILGITNMLAGAKFEVCTVLGNDGQWGYNPYTSYKTARRVVLDVISVVSKGGNLLLNLGPGPTGEWDPKAVAIFEQVGDWMAINGEAIFATRPVWPYQYTVTTSIWGTYSEFPDFFLTMKDKVMYVMMPTLDDVIPEWVIFPWLRPAMFRSAINITNVELLGYGADVQWELTRGGVEVVLPSETKRTPMQYAFVWKVTLG
eukprot:TRINITY_DN4458_c0_g1_i1.p1 TRINITY_DN4458_c0_g1~~TRINITY_DN4458_c0_g1_i1.p1  ORF type:complete len:494 (-),score=93.05 TRINITY_DN4458_c0_g1_i1:4-1485(-)